MDYFEDILPFDNSVIPSVSYLCNDTFDSQISVNSKLISDIPDDLANINYHELLGISEEPKYDCMQSYFDGKQTPWFNCWDQSNPKINYDVTSNEADNNQDLVRVSIDQSNSISNCPAEILNTEAATNFSELIQANPNSTSLGMSSEQQQQMPENQNNLSTENTDDLETRRRKNREAGKTHRKKMKELKMKKNAEFESKATINQTLKHDIEKKKQIIYKLKEFIRTNGYGHVTYIDVN